MQLDWFKISFGNILTILGVVVTLTLTISDLKSDIRDINTKLFYIDKDVTNIQKNVEKLSP